MPLPCNQPLPSPPVAPTDGCPADAVSYAILIDSMLCRWNADREGQAHLLALIQQRWEEACEGPLAPHTYLHQPQVRPAA